MPIHPFRSQRLVFTAIEPEDDDFLAAKTADVESFYNTAPFLVVPQPKSAAAATREYYRDKCLLAVKICLPAPVSSAASAGGEATLIKPIPIGTLALHKGEANQSHHLNTSIGVSLLRAYQGQGYGSEAIKWALRWAFRYGNLHRVEIGAFAWNEGAIKLYKRLGFVPEGIKREHLWYDGKYWDQVELAMLESEWRELYGKEEESAVEGAEKRNGDLTVKQ